VKSADYVANLISQEKTSGVDPQKICWDAALACVGWPYVFGDRGELCTPSHRRARYSDDHPTIKTKCKNFEGKGSCSGCQWYPNGKKVRCYDCRGFTYWILLQVYEWKLMGTGATAQWDDEKNWTAKGTIDTMPKDTLCCLFVRKGSKMEHTGFGLNNETIECSSGVQHFTTRNKKWTHWGVPVPVSGDVPQPEPSTGHPTLRRGDKGPAVAELQGDLVRLGYGVGPCGIDGDFGRATHAAVENFQLDHKLTVDGICGPKTWDAIDRELAKLEQDPAAATYSVTIRGLDLEQAEALCKAWPTATMEKE
jgi:hypothetical protein